MQPRQIANTDSSRAAKIKPAITSFAASEKSRSASNRADDEKTNPIVWANLFGGPGTNLWSKFNFGVTTRVTNSASGLNAGPAATRAANPYASATSTSVELVSRNVVLIKTTPAATSRADVSLAGFGKGKRFVMRPSIYRYPTNLVKY